MIALVAEEDVHENTVEKAGAFGTVVIGERETLCRAGMVSRDEILGRQLFAPDA